MFFFNNQIFQQNNENKIETRYNLNMMSNIRRRQQKSILENNNKTSNNQENNIKTTEKLNKIKSLKIVEPKDPRDSNKIDIIKNKQQYDPSNINDWNDEFNDWIEKEDNICV